MACDPGLIGHVLCVAAAVLGCSKESARPHEASRVAVPDVAPALSPAEIEALRAEVRRSLAAELRPEVLAELRRELMPEVKAALQNELRPDAATATPDTTVTTQVDAGPGDAAQKETETPGTPDEPKPGDVSPSAAAPAGDVWSHPGTKIWPSGGGLKLVELMVGTALEDKLPTDVRTHYPSTPEILYCYTVFENPQPDATVTHVWRRGSRLVSRVELEVGKSPKWRTWSKQRTQPHWTGLWSCEVLGEDGQQLGLTVFQIGG